ncbi:hypothetical protein KSU1_D0310 [Candidatus Jettenia caeni]|uniref:Uncharacterized protein n=1 Tax=Candidatus Jettenia caeni TaxID=247490 RepID=I3IPH4_9BACT|nr:hypothetical protein KSU1_D0310 [Candidatus Jettenia caeni]
MLIIAAFSGYKGAFSGKYPRMLRTFMGFFNTSNSPIFAKIYYVKLINLHKANII